MPIYEYSCEDCGNEFELLVRDSEPPACPTCGTSRLEKRFSVPAAHTRSSSLLPMSERPSAGGGCGLPQCGMGGCGM
jgi:putative FmdB family regulatory protein